jgi:hypothetical protein
MVEVVDAWDPDEALVTAANLHPELPRPRVAVPATWPGPPATGHRSGTDRVEPD